MMLEELLFGMRQGEGAVQLGVLEKGAKIGVEKEPRERLTIQGFEWIHPSVVSLIGKEIEKSEIRYLQKMKKEHLQEKKRDSNSSLLKLKIKNLFHWMKIIG